jgi:mRNA-degrading endonuclease toxin of MazEF toxin-antitoxin module
MMIRNAEDENAIERGQIYFVFLDPAFGREIGGYTERPVLVVSINDIHRKTRLVTIVPGTSTPSAVQNVVRVEPDPSN